ncbi:uncharacterized protein A4U43_C10F5670 [Asparagus officinalis]|uniref:Uncharacterized protein n=1 Tax=Asparagus officinalis TaxID=4686 RepID=A0A5P1E0Z5_ASPOF|nr:uncharacterized protein LOC109826267 [Asparagus officinalis]ONK56251.1 uncharacterized protein A4U43_C10F5670 [Asparagus officinalis]
MENLIGSVVTGLVRTVGNLFGAPLNFLSGKSCSSVCGSTWDIICYVENFCIANLLKLAAVLALLYIVLLFLYLLHKIGICYCIGRSICKMTWACFTSCFSSCEHGCMFLWYKIKNVKRVHRDRMRDIEDYLSSSSEDYLEEESVSYRHNPRSMKFRRSLSHRAKERRRIHLERSLRARSHRIRVGINQSSVYLDRRDKRKHSSHSTALHHNIKVTRTSKFVQKGNVNRIHHRKW